MAVAWTVKSEAIEQTPIWCQLAPTSELKQLRTASRLTNLIHLIHAYLHVSVSTHIITSSVLVTDPTVTALSDA